jgi:hypothetical protein
MYVYAYVSIPPIRRALEEEARGLDEALAALGVADSTPPTLTFAQYLERELPRVKEEKPGLKLPQYKDLVFKAWERR